MVDEKVIFPVGGAEARRSATTRGRAEARPSEKTEAIVCPVCGAEAMPEKCKVICRSDICRGRVVMNCSEF